MDEKGSDKGKSPSKSGEPINGSGDLSFLSSISKTPTTPDEYPELRPFPEPSKGNPKSTTTGKYEVIAATNGKKPASYSKSDLGIESPSYPSSVSSPTPDFIDDAGELLDDFVNVAVDAGNLIKKEVLEKIELFVKPEDFSSEYSWIDGLFGVISMVTFFADFFSDVVVFTTMKDDPQAHYWATATLVLAVLPIAIQSMFSIYWYWFDERKFGSQDECGKKRKPRPAKWSLIVICHLLLLGPVLRQLEVLYFGIRSKKVLQEVEEDSDTKTGKAEVDTPRDKGETALINVTLSSDSKASRYNHLREMWLHAEIDSAGLDFIGTLLQDIPQSALQLYIMTQTLPSLSQSSTINRTLLAQFASVSISLFTAALTVTGFVRAVRLPSSGLQSLSPLEAVMLTLSHVFAIAPQVGCFALFASKQLTACLIVLVVHWLLATILTFLQFLWLPVTEVRKAMFAHDKQSGTCPRLDDLAFSAALGVALLVTFVDVDGAAPHVHAISFGVTRLVEELILVTVWYFSTSRGSWWHWFPFLLVSLFFVLSTLFSIIFYILMARGSKSQWNSFRSLPQSPSL